MSCAFIDFSGFVVNDGSYIIKELAVVACNNKFIHRVFKPPFKYTFLNKKARETNKSISQNEHQLIWYEGDMYFCAECIEKKLLSIFGPKTLFYTVDNEIKLKTLKYNFPHMRLVQYNKSEDLIPVMGYCPVSHNPKFCALHNCIKMANHYLTNFIWPDKKYINKHGI